MYRPFPALPLVFMKRVIRDELAKRAHRHRQPVLRKEEVVPVKLVLVDSEA